MNQRIDLALFKAKAVLCIVVALGLHVVMGCGTASTGLVSSNRINLTANHPLTQVLTGTMFAGATAIEVNRETGTFRVIFNDDSREISGVIEKVNGQPQMRQIHISHSGQSMTYAFNSQHQLVAAVSSDGQSWTRPAGNLLDTYASAASDNPYVTANADLIELGRQAEENGATAQPGQSSGANGGAAPGIKVGASSFFWAPFLFIFTFVPAAFLFVLELVVVISLI